MTIPVMQGIFLAISAAVLLACLLADIVYVIADPRTRRGRRTDGRRGRSTHADSAAAKSPPARRRSARRMPPKAKVGGAILGMFVLVAIIGPTLAPLRPVAPRSTRATGPFRRRSTTCSGPTSTARTSSHSCSSGCARRSCSGVLTATIATFLVGGDRRHAGFLGRHRRRGAVAADERVHRPAGPAAADRRARLPPAQRANCRRRSCSARSAGRGERA